MNKFLIVITGESYRLPSVIDNEGIWGGGMRFRGVNENFKSVERQYLASKSHIRLLDEIEKKFDLVGEIFINSYKLDDDLDKNLISIYEKKLLTYNLHTFSFPYESNLHRDTIDRLNNFNCKNYEFILFVRMDFYIRPFFISYFDLSTEKIIYAHIDSNIYGFCDALKNSKCHHGEYLGNTFPLICHNITYVPKKHFELLLGGIAWSGHESAERVCGYIGRNNIDLFIRTYHYCSTDHEWNPLYCMVDRQESKNFFNVGFRFEPESGKKITVDNDEVYQEMIDKDTIIKHLENYEKF